MNTVESLGTSGRSKFGDFLRQRWLLGVGAFVLASVLCIVPSILAFSVVPLLQGPDEHLHAKNVFFRFTRPTQIVRVEAGMSSPGMAPNGQAHQAPLWYWILARSLHLFLSVDEVGSFFDYEAAFESSEQASGYPFQIRPHPDESANQLQRALYGLRGINLTSFIFVLGLAYFLGVLMFPGKPLLAFSTMLFAGMIPSALWRTIFISNDNAVAAIAAVSFVAAVYPLLKKLPYSKGHVVLLALLAAAAFLAKSNGIAVFAANVLCISLGQNTFRQKIGLGALLSAVFLCLVLPQLAINYSVDGDPLLSHAVKRGYPFILQPLSLWQFLSEHHFLPVLLTNFFYPFPDIDFPPIAIRLWHLLLAMAALGIIWSTVRSEAGSLHRRLVAAGLGAIALNVLVIGYYGRLFPIPHGRYIHAIILPAAALIVLGVLRFLQCLRISSKRAEWITFLILGLSAISTHTFSLKYLLGRYAKPAQSSPVAQALGGDIIAINFDNTQEEEILLLERFPTRAYVARFTEASLRVEPAMTRALGLPFDFFLRASLRPEGEDILRFRPGIPAWYRTPVTDFVTADPALSAFSDYAIREQSFGVSGALSSFPVVADFNHDGHQDLGMFQPHEGRWLIETNAEQAFQTGGAQSLHTHKLRTKKVELLLPLAIRQNGRTYLATYSSRTGTVRINDFTRESFESKVRLSKGAHPLVADLDRNGSDELIFWHAGDPCLSIASLPDFHQHGDLSDVAAFRLCPIRHPAVSVFAEHSKVFSHLLADGCPRVCSFDKRVGDLWCFNKRFCEGLPASVPGEINVDIESEISYYDTGWYGEEKRSRPFRREEMR